MSDTDANLMWQILRTIIVLSEAAADTEHADVRDDVHDQLASLLQLCWRSPDQVVLYRWCVTATTRFQRLADQDVPGPSTLHALAAVLRLQLIAVPSVQPRPVPSPAIPIPARRQRVRRTTVAGKNHQRVLRYLETHPQARTKDLVGYFAETLSGRTVKRCLKDLTIAHAITRVRQEDGSVSYIVDVVDTGS